MRRLCSKINATNKICKLIRFVKQTPWQEIVAHKKTARIDAGTSCLPYRDILTYFDSPHKNSNQPSKP